MPPDFLWVDLFGVIVGDAERDFGDWRVGRFAWKLENIKVLKNPVKLSGKQGLWNFVYFSD